MRFFSRVLLIGISVLWIAGCATTKPHGKEPRDMRPAHAIDKAVNAADYPLLPVPRSVQFGTARFLLPMRGVASFLGGEANEPLVQSLAVDALRGIGGAWGTDTQRGGKIEARFVIDSGSVQEAEGYVLRVDAEGLTITAHDAAGLWNGVMTLRQLAACEKGSWTLPFCTIYDYPSFPNRGVMLDVSRDKVPTMETLYGIVDRMASWKLNQLQLYTEHTFAYKGHPKVWEKASPMTPEDIRALDAYCRERHIELVPNQNSFGHMGRWLQYPEYQHLGEILGGCSDLCAVDPDCIPFLEGLFADLLPNFTSRQVNVGCDETIYLGKGRSKEAVRKRGEGRVYLEFLTKIRDIVAKQGFRMQFWGDIIMQHPELVPELPKDVIAMEWGYEADHPFEEHGKRFAASGIPYYVVPGTSTWLSFAGRTDNAVKNLRNAAVNGAKNGAIGYLITDWGDLGHFQPMPASYLGFVYGAGLSWCVETNLNLDIPRALDMWAFEDAAGVMGRLAYDLGDAYVKSGALIFNRTLYYQILLFQPDDPMTKNQLARITREGLRATEEAIDAAMANLSQARMNRADAAQIAEEFTQTANLMRFACHVGDARLRAGGVGIAQIASEDKKQLADELRPLIAEHRRLWLLRNRPGGLDDSAKRFEDILAKLESR